MFDGRVMGTGEVVRSLYLLPVYFDLWRQKHVKKGYERGVSMMLVEQFAKLALKIPYTIVERNGAEQTPLMMSAPLCYMQCKQR